MSLFIHISLSLSDSVLITIKCLWVLQHVHTRWINHVRVVHIFPVWLANVYKNYSEIPKRVRHTSELVGSVLCVWW